MAHGCRSERCAVSPNSCKGFGWCSLEIRVELKDLGGFRIRYSIGAEYSGRAESTTWRSRMFLCSIARLGHSTWLLTSEASNETGLKCLRARRSGSLYRFSSLHASLDIQRDGSRSTAAAAAEQEQPLLLRVLRGDLSVPRPPVWLMRQAGRYMGAFRSYSDRYAFRERAENPEIAVELSLQPWRAFGVDAVIMFADILTPLPAMGLDYQIVPGKGPCIKPSIRSMKDLARIDQLTIGAVEAALPFIGATLTELARQLATRRPRPALLGFLGAPFTLAAYAIDGEGGRTTAGRHVKHMMYTAEGQNLLHRLLSIMTESMVAYAVYQARMGAEAIQIFDSWAHLLPPEDYREFSLPYIAKLVQGIRAADVQIPLILFANGSCGKLDTLKMIFPRRTIPAADAPGLDALGLDWKTSMAEARRLYGPQAILQGNIDPMVLAFGEQATITAAIDRCVCSAAGGPHILNLGHGVMQDTPEDSVAYFCDHVRALAGANWYRELRAALIENSGML